MGEKRCLAGFRSTAQYAALSSTGTKATAGKSAAAARTATTKPTGDEHYPSSAKSTNSAPSSQIRAIPKLRRKLIKGHGYGHARFNKHDRYFGPWPLGPCPKEVEEKYRAALAEYLTSGRSPRSNAPATVKELLAFYLQWALVHYIKSPTEVRDVRHSLHELRREYGDVRLASFGLKELEHVQSLMVRRGLKRGVVNQRIGRIKRIWKWAAQREYVGPAQWHLLQLLEPLRKGRTDAAESEAVTAPDRAAVEAVVRLVSPQLAAMIRLQQWTGMRPGEVTQMSERKLLFAFEGDEKVWVYRCWFKGKERTIVLGPKAQFLLRHWRRSDDEPLFQPCESRRTRRSGKKYAVTTYARAIARACRKAGVRHWHPHQLRHERATTIQKLVGEGLIAAQVALQHENSAITRRYAHAETAISIKIALAHG